MTQARLMTLCILLWLGCCGPAPAATSAASAAAVKAAFVYNFIKFTEWPEGTLGDTQSAITICTNTDDELRSALERLNGKQAKGRAIVVRDTRQGNWQECHVAVLNKEPHRRPDKADPILTVATYTDERAILRLFLVGNKLRFAVNLKAARAASIRLSAKLLSVAAEVHDES